MITDLGHPSIAKVFTTDAPVIYSIPRYQREYTWGQKDWANLYDDVFESGAEGNSGYFLGSIIVIQMPIDSATHIINYEVIDGQQRLTTISLLLAALYAKMREYPEAIDEDINLDYVHPLKNRLILKENKGITRVTPQVQNNNLEDYRWTLKEYVGLNSSAQKPKYYGNRKIAKAFSYFHDRFGAEIERGELSDDDAIQMLLSKYSRICSAVLVQITVDSRADAYSLFASLNNRGVPLSAVDLIKNTLLAKATDANESELDYYFDQWQEMLLNLGDDYTVQERFFRQNYDAFRREANKPFIQENGGQFPLGSVATRSNLLKIYETRIGQDSGALSVLDELIENSILYAQIIGTNRDGISKKFGKMLTCLERAQGVPSYLLLLFLMKRADELKLDEAKLAAIVSTLVPFFVRRNLTDTPPTRDLERMFISICEEIVDNGLKGIEIVRFVRSKLISVSASDTLFEEKLSGPIYDLNPDMTRFVLTTLAEPSVTREMKDLWERNSSGAYIWTIEHIFPQGENIPQSWIDMIGCGNKEDAQQAQAELVHTLGNLTITGYNSKLSNMSFAQKRDRKDSNGAFIGYRNRINLNAELAQADEWTRQRIKDRTAKLVRMALNFFSLSDEAQ